MALVALLGLVAQMLLVDLVAAMFCQIYTTLARVTGPGVASLVRGPTCQGVRGPVDLPWEKTAKVFRVFLSSWSPPASKDTIFIPRRNVKALRSTDCSAVTAAKDT